MIVCGALSDVHMNAEAQCHTSESEPHGLPACVVTPERTPRADGTVPAPVWATHERHCATTCRARIHPPVWSLHLHHDLHTAACALIMRCSRTHGLRAQKRPRATFFGAGEPTDDGVLFQSDSSTGTATWVAAGDDGPALAMPPKYLWSGLKGE